ncbi:class F sortase [Streptomyces sulphureus]|uniref:class F sortase n=1 Tax=Streptomyces sulphureus TaxID=47758 RepID=UPI0006859A57|nr:class F sortase [Streptomyces sulphureus]
MSEQRAACRGRSVRRRVLFAAGWVLLLLAAWVFARGATSLHAGGPLAGLPGSLAEAGRLAGGGPEHRVSGGTAEGRPYAEGPQSGPERPRPGAHEPLAGGAVPRTLVIESLGVRAPVVPGDEGARLVPNGRPDAVGWYSGGPVPGADGTALLVGRSDAGALAGLAGVRPGQRVGVERGGSRAEFTVAKRQSVECGSLTGGPYPSQPAGGPQDPLGGPAPHGGAHRAELRVLACTQEGGPGADVMVSAYLTGVRKS